MAASTFSKAALNNARSHKPWEHDENDERDNIETPSFDFDTRLRPRRHPSAVSYWGPAPEVQHTSVAHEITHVSLRHFPSMPDINGATTLTGNAHAPAGEQPVELQGTSAPAGGSFGAPTAQAIGLTQAPAPQADGIGGPTS